VVKKKDFSLSLEMTGFYVNPANSEILKQQHVLFFSLLQQNTSS